MNQRVYAFALGTMIVRHLQPLVFHVLCFDLDREPRLLPWTCKIGASRQGKQRIVLHFQPYAATRSKAAQIEQLIC